MSLTRRLHMRLARPAPLCPLREPTFPPHPLFSPSHLAASRSLCTRPSATRETCMHCAPNECNRERERERGRRWDRRWVGEERERERERINTRADTYRGRINHRKIMHVTSAERVCNGETCTRASRIPPPLDRPSRSNSRPTRAAHNHGIRDDNWWWFLENLRVDGVRRHCVVDQTST